MVIVVQGEGLLAILSTDCLGSKSATVPSLGWTRASSAPSILSHWTTWVCTAYSRPSEGPLPVEPLSLQLLVPLSLRLPP